MIYLIVLGWLVCAFFAAGIGFSCDQYLFPILSRTYVRDEIFWNVGFGLVFGPIALLVQFFSSGGAQYGIWRSPNWPSPPPKRRG